jgi:6-phosphogluconolactonase
MNRLRRSFLATLVFGLAFASTPTARAQQKDFFVYMGTYTGFKYVRHNLPVGPGQSKGIYVSRFNAATGELGEPQLAAEIVNPSFVTIHPNGKFLYAVTEDPTSVGPPLDHASYVSAFAIDHKTGKLRLINTLPTGGTSTCFISMDKTGGFVMMAHFGSGSISILRVHADGSLGEETAFMLHMGHSLNPDIQNMPHPHSIVPSSDNKHVIVSDLGLDKIFVYDFDAKTGMLSPPEPSFATVKAGGGPRHFVFDPTGRFGYQLSEMSGDLDVFKWNATQGKLDTVQSISTITPGFVGDNHDAEIEVRSDGRFLYESNRRVRNESTRGPDTIGVFEINAASGEVKQVQESPTGGLIPRSFAIDPTGGYLLSANEISNNVVVYKLDAVTGKMSPTGKSITIDTPVCLKFVPVKR